MVNQIIYIIDIVLLVILLGFVVNWAWNKIQEKRYGGNLTNEQFKAGMRKAQIIDVRESAEFKKKHIDGARNIPSTMFKYQYSEIRPALPVYIYSDSKAITLRAVKVLKKHDYPKVFWLTDGFEKWDGRTKVSKY